MSSYLAGRDTTNLPDGITYMAEVDADLRTRFARSGTPYPGLAAIFVQPAYAKLRLALTLLDPLLFALVYLSHMITDKHGQLTFAEMHLDLARYGHSFRRRLTGNEGPNDVWLGPRRSGKSQWLTRILVLWALAHGHSSRREGLSPFVLLVSVTDEAVTGHYGDVEFELLHNDQLLADFPGLTKVKNRRAKWAGKNGGLLVPVSFESRIRGLNITNRDPDWIIGDDLEEDNATSTRLDQDVRDWTRKVRMTAPDARCSIGGTTVNYRGLIHQLAMRTFEPRAQIPAEILAWTDPYRTHYYDPLIPTGDPDAPERSTWPAKWPVEYLQKVRERQPLVWELEWLNRPTPLMGTWWRRDGFDRVDLHDFVPYEVGLFVDPAKMDKKEADETGICLAAVDADGRVLIVYSYGERGLVGDRLDAKLVELAMAWRNTPFEPMFIAAEGNVIGDNLRPILRRSTAVVGHLIIFNQQSVRPKEARFVQAAQHYDSHMVAHSGHQPVEQQMTSFRGKGSLAQDGVIDVVCSAVLWWRRPEWIRPPDQGGFSLLAAI